MTVIYPSPIFGPVHSRRLGISLGINLLPGDGKVCTFDCIYCECGFNRDFRPKEKMPEREAVAAALETRLKEMAAEGLCPDVLTFAGNGEPTLHPHFPEIIADTIAIRDRYCPNAKVSVLSNATQVVKPAVRAALMLADNPIMKLDTVNPGYIGRVDRPTGHYAVRDIIVNYGKTHNVAVWDFYNVGGGAGASAKWLDAGYMQSDRLHLKEKGYHLQGELLAKALLKLFQAQ